MRLCVPRRPGSVARSSRRRAPQLVHKTSAVWVVRRELAAVRASSPSVGRKIGKEALAPRLIGGWSHRLRNDNTIASLGELRHRQECVRRCTVATVSNPAPTHIRLERKCRPPRLRAVGKELAAVCVSSSSSVARSARSHARPRYPFSRGKRRHSWCRQEGVTPTRTPSRRPSPCGWSARRWRSCVPRHRRRSQDRQGDSQALGTPFSTWQASAPLVSARRLVNLNAWPRIVLPLVL